MIQVGDLVRFRNEALLAGGDHSRCNRGVLYRGKQRIFRVKALQGRVAVLDQIDNRNGSKGYGSWLRVGIRNLVIHRKDPGHQVVPTVRWEPIPDINITSSVNWDAPITLNFGIDDCVDGSN